MKDKDDDKTPPREIPERKDPGKETPMKDPTAPGEDNPTNPQKDDPQPIVD